MPMAAASKLWVCHQYVFNFIWINIETGDQYHVFLSVNNENNRPVP